MRDSDSNRRRRAARESALAMRQGSSPWSRAWYSATQACKPIAMLRAGAVVFLSLFVLCLLARSVGRHLTGYVSPARRLRGDRDPDRRRER